MLNSDAKNNYEEAAKEALEIAKGKEPRRAEEFTKHAHEWIQAYSFYRDHKITESRIESQLRGIDFNYPIAIKLIPPPKQVIQYQPPTMEGKFPDLAIGNYWADPNDKPSPQNLGISDYGRLRDPGKPWAPAPGADNVKKTPWKFESDSNKGQILALISKVAPIVDNWSRNNDQEDAAAVPVICTGGGTQYFAPKGKEVYTLMPDQKAIQVDNPIVRFSKKFGLS